MAEQQEVAGGLVWTARPDVLQQYSLPVEVPQSVLDWLAAPPPPPLPIPTKGKRSSSQSSLLFKHLHVALPLTVATLSMARISVVRVHAFANTVMSDSSTSENQLPKQLHIAN